MTIYYLVGVTSLDLGIDSQQKSLLSSKVVVVVQQFEAMMTSMCEFERRETLISVRLCPLRKVVELDLVLDHHNAVNDSTE